MTPVLAILVGAIMGSALGLIGTGGAILAVPALVYIFGYSGINATTASLLIVITTATVSVIPRFRKKQVQIKSALVLWSIGLIGNYFGVQLSKVTSERSLLIGFGVILIASASSMLWRTFQRDFVAKKRSSWALPLAGSLIGFMAGLFGVGGAFLAIPTLILVFGASAQVAAGTGLALMILNSVTALLFRFQNIQNVSWDIPIIILISAICFSIFATQKGAALKSITLERIFAYFLFLVGIATLIESILK
ncbi:MAG: sulfite exporter TauE/SafE family protein [Actinobacteria bacterium]|nr:sulfite exporter TauE/SafE family protein [Actinomycetota bacterium]